MANVRLIDDRNALESLRSSDFDTVSAYGEVVDNSLDAGAKNIRIQFSTKRIGNRQFQHIQQIAFGDDGKGMNLETLNHCMKLGWSSRFNERNAIGRFGVGMTLAAIHECLRCQIYSKERGGNWISTYIDLEEVKTETMQHIPTPVSARLPQEYKELVGDESGTLVIWSKYDRQSDDAGNLADEASIWMGRTYRHFIWHDDVSITINGEEVKAVDPLYATVTKTRFPEDPVATLYPDMEISWPVDKTDKPENAPDESIITIRMSLLPEELRPEKGCGGWAATRERLIPLNEGISILRNRREVFYGAVPYWKVGGGGWSEFEDIDRWWGCEVQFDAVLDRAFLVKNIKQGAVPNRSLKKALKGKIIPTRETFLERIREVWSKAAERKAKEAGKRRGGVKRAGDHTRAEEIAKVTPTGRSEIDSHKDKKKEVPEFVKNHAEHYNKEEQAMLATLFESQPFSIMEQRWKDSKFFESSHLGGSAVLEYNMGHPFFERIYASIGALEAEGKNYKIAKELKVMIDLLVISYARSESRFASDDNYSAEDFLELLRSNWGQYLQQYLKRWQKEEGRDDE